MKHEVIINGVEDLERAAAEFLEKIGDSTLVAFFAPMGSGKTTFTTAICKVLGVTDPVGSPTFAIVNEYMRGDGEPMYHFDFYRINRLSEAIEIGLYDYLDSSKMFHGTVEKEFRSLMNVPFITDSKELDAEVVAATKAAGFDNLKGHRSVGGMRASIYNAMPMEGVQALVAALKEFEAKE